MPSAVHAYGAIVAAFLVATLPLSIHADGPAAVKFDFSNEPALVRADSTLEFNLGVQGVPRIASATIEFSVAGQGTMEITCEFNAATSQIQVVLPVPQNASGWLTYSVAANEVRSETRNVPIALEQELDITGDAAVALLYPIGGPEYTVRYVPCCNIFGGITIATRQPVNPESSSAGLPEKILSDFMILAPDGLSASTMGMYMDFRLGPDAFNGLTPALYEFNGREWVEYASYELDPARGYLSMHCPNGGTFVIAAKP